MKSNYKRNPFMTVEVAIRTGTVLRSSSLIFLCLLFIRSVSAMSCYSLNYTRGSGYEDSLKEVASALTKSSLSTLYGHTASTSNATRQAAYGMFQCRGDVSQKLCSICVSTTLVSAMNQDCPNSMGAADQPMQRCHVRYDDNPALFDGTSPDTDLWYYVWEGNRTDAAYLRDVVAALQNVTGSAPYNPNYYASTHEGFAYALAQCDGYLSPQQCSTCLSRISDASKYLNQSERGGIYYGSCFYTYDSQLFFGTPSALAPSSSPAAPPALVVLSYSDSGSNDSSISIGSLGDDTKPLFSDQVSYFSYEELKAATLDFHPHNKIGAGGFGPVYKGKLGNGVEVAIKKLSANSCQGNTEFMNEVNIITSIQHTNLIKLYGCCVEGPDKRLLVYEYLPNKSLDKYLFADYEGWTIDACLLDWKTRLNIIIGTARGLAYLHHDSQIRIIHRDIKASNILLDQDLVPKITDFGIAKLFSDDQSHVTTRVAGTFGYLSPEYALHGYLSEKVDVYSFGVVTLEILSGRKNTDIQQPLERQRLMHWAWNCYEQGEQMKLLDPKLSSSGMDGKVLVEEVLRVIHVALLCLQSSPVKRPSMREVIQLFLGESQILEIPRIPQYNFTNPETETNMMESNTRLSEIHHSDQSQVLEESGAAAETNHGQKLTSKLPLIGYFPLPSNPSNGKFYLAFEGVERVNHHS